MILLYQPTRTSKTRMRTTAAVLALLRAQTLVPSVEAWLHMSTEIAPRKSWDFLGQLLASGEAHRDLISVSVAGETTEDRRTEIAAELLRGILGETAPRIVFFSFPDAGDAQSDAVLSAIFLHAIAHPPRYAEAPDEILRAANALAPRRWCYAALPEENAASAHLHQLDAMRVRGWRVIREVFA